MKDGYIQIDIDNMNEAEKIYSIVQAESVKCNVIKTTRGMHFYFQNKDPIKKSQAINTPLQIKADVNVGENNALVYILIDGEFREWLQEYDELDFLPIWLKPFKSKRKIKFMELCDGDGRNDILYNYILTLRRFGFSVDECKECLNIINKYLFQTPLSDKELETITRDEAFPADSFADDNGKFQHNLFGDYLIGNEKIILYQKSLYIYNDGVYATADDEIERAMVNSIPNIKMHMRREVMSYLRLKAAEVEDTASSRLIALKNNIYDIETDETMEFSPDIVITNKIDYELHDYHEVMDRTLNKISCNDKTIRKLIEEMVGVCLYRRVNLTRAFILTGEGSNGKSTLLKCISKLIGGKNCSYLSLQDTTDKFRLAEIHNKLANIGDDIPSKYVDDSSLFKKLVTGEMLTAERKGKDPFSFKSYATLIFSCNKIPRIEDKSNGLKRRILIIPFDAEFKETDEDFDPFIEDKLITDEALGYLLKLGIEGLQRVLRHGFTNSKKVQKNIDDFERENNPVMTFAEECKIDKEPTKEVYLAYTTWCRENGYFPLANNEFGKVLKNKFGFVSVQKRISDKRIRIYEHIKN